MGTRPPLAEDRQFLGRRSLLRGRARQVMLEAGFEPGAVHDYPDGDGFNIAFGYIQRLAGGSSRQRYIEVHIPVDAYLEMSSTTQDRIVGDLRTELEARASAEQ